MSSPRSEDAQSSDSLQDGSKSIWSETTREAHIQGVDPLKPATFGGVVKGYVDSEFNLMSPPDVTRETRIIGLCGIDDCAIDPSDPNSEGKASPAFDGWFLSDFFMWVNLLKGVGAKQTWILADNTTPEKLLDRYLPTYAPGYLHGKPDTNQPRKIVLDRDIAKTLPEILTVDRRELLSMFLRVVEDESRTALQEDQSLLILVFGHGQPGPGIYVGAKRSTLGKHKRLTPEAFRDVLQPKTRTTSLTTSCYGGGFCCDPELNITAFAAAGPATKSMAWPNSRSIGRSCGSVYTPTVLDAMKGEGNLKHSLMKENEPLEYASSIPQKISLAEFDALVYKTLFTGSFASLAHTQDIRFSAQNDGWEQNWSRRTGFPLVDFKQRFDALADYQEQHSSLSTDQTISPESRLGSWKSRLSRISLVREHARLYMECYPDSDYTAPNRWLHKAIRSLFDGTKTDVRAQERIFDVLEYRFGIMKIGTRFAKLGSVRFPGGLDCEAFDYLKWQKNCAGFNKNKFDALWKLLVDAKLFPEPLEEQGPDFSFRALQYLTAALYENANEEAKASDIVGRWSSLKNKTVEHQVNTLRRSNNIRATARTMFKYFGRTLRDLSPKRQRASQQHFPNPPLAEDTSKDKRKSTGSAVPYLPPDEPSSRREAARRHTLSEVMKDSIHR